MPRPRTIVVVVLIPLMLILLAGRSFHAESIASSDQLDPGSSALPTPSPTMPRQTAGALQPLEQSDSYRSYAMAVPELRGLPANAPAATALELWVTWDRPITKAPRLQRLLSATLERIIPGLTPEAPETAILRIRTRDLDELLFADRFGALSVALLP